MSHKIIGIADSNNPIQTDYVKNQLQSIKKQFIDVEIEFNNENSQLVNKYCRKPARFPTYIIMKNDIYKTHITGKIDNSKLFEQLKAKLG